MSDASKRKNDEDVAEPGPSPSKKTKKLSKLHENPPTKLSHINFDCLVQIFKPLSRLDLMNIIVYDMALMEAARFVFQKQFAKDLFHLSNKPLFDVYGKSRVVKYLKAFGCVIESLYLSYHTKYREFDRLIETAIIENCSETLIKIKFRNARSISMKNIYKPFEKVEDIEFISSEFGELILNLSKWFPNATSLKLDKQNPQSYECRRRLERHHPNVTHFSIKENQIPNRKCMPNLAWKKLDNYNLISFLKLNPQLRTIYIEEYDRDLSEHRLNQCGIRIDYELLTTIYHELKNLQDLYLSFSSEPLWPATLPDINFERLRKLEVDFGGSSILKYFPLSFDRINHLSLKAIDVGSDFLKYIRENRNVKKLSLNAPWKKMRYFFRFIDLVSTLPNLKEICIMYQSHFHASNYVLELLDKCKKLDKLTILGAERTRSKKLVMLSGEQLDNIAGLIGPEWRATVSFDAKYDLGDHYVLIIDRVYDSIELD